LDKKFKIIFEGDRTGKASKKDPQFRSVEMPSCYNVRGLNSSTVLIKPNNISSCFCLWRYV